MDTTQLLKGVLDVAVLAVLRAEDGYGYDILRRLYQGGFLSSYIVPSEEGPPRRYYALNKAGRDQLELSKKSWRAFADTLEHLLSEVAA
jgi:PadR family transcriptional regulator PadR